MKAVCLFVLIALSAIFDSNAQTRKVALVGSSTTAGLATSSTDSSWARRFNYYYKYQLGVLDTTYNLGVSSTNLYHGMPTSYTPPAGRPSPDPLHNVTMANSLLSDLTTPANGVVIINFPSGGYDTYTIPEIMTALQRMYDSATRTGNRCFVTTTQPRTDAGFNTSAVKKKLADIKDSIINRFGVARTINFWDGMYNPADTTILPAYSAGDNVHFNNAGHRVLFERVRAKNVLNLPAVNYRSNVSPTGLWSDASSWQIHNGTTWVTATEPPSSGSGTITIQNGDSIRINNFTELDQVVIESTGILVLFNTATTAKAVATLNNASGDDLINNGKLYISANGVLNGDGTIQNNSGALFTLRNRGVLEATTNNAGTWNVSNTGIIRNRTVTNNKTFVLQDFTLNLVNAGFINNDSVSITGGGTTYIADSTLTGGTFINNASGVICRQSASGITNFNTSVTFTNNGRVKGLGEYAFYNTVAGSTGSIHPGTSPGRLTVNPAFISGRSMNINIEISSTGAVQGTTYDHLILSAITPVTKNISSSTLTVTDNAADPIGTVYTIITPASGTGSITGTFASVNLSPTLSGPNYNGGSFITVTKTGVLPLNWGNFTAIPVNATIELKWSTLQETNTSHFIIEHSTDGTRFTAVGNTAARGNTTTTSNYSFVHASPSMNATNYYRLRQVDKDGESAYSGIRQVVLNTKSLLQIHPNPVQNKLNITSRLSNAYAVIYDLQGKKIQERQLTQGLNTFSCEGMVRGTYLVNIIFNDEIVLREKIIKQ